MAHTQITSIISKNLRVAVIGQGVIGFSSALAIEQNFPSAKITLFSDRNPYFEKKSIQEKQKAFSEWARASFEWFAELEKKYSPEETGVKLVSGHIQSDNKALLDIQAEAYGDIVYNFHWLTDRERNSLFPNPSKYAIHYTPYASEGRRYVPWLHKQLSLLDEVHFQERKIESLQQLVDENTFDCIVNCAGLNGGKLAGDDDSVYPVRGVALEVRAPWQKHFNYKDVDSFTIPLVDTVILGTKKEAHRSDLKITDEDRTDIWERYLKLHPTFKGAEFVSEWSGIRPARPTVRLEHCILKASEPSGNECHVIHNYGHGSNGFTMSWGCSLNVVKLLSEHVQSCKDGQTPINLKSMHDYVHKAFSK